MAKLLGSFKYEQLNGSTLMRKEPIGVCGLITPWNWPVNQIACKVAPALAAGCTMVLKPSEIAPLSGYLFTQILDEAGVPPGVFNMVNGDEPTVGVTIGPLGSEAQFEKVQRLIKKGMEEGAELVTGGPGRPEGMKRGYFVRPTVFGNVRNDMTIAREEVFGPVLAIIPYENED